MATVLVNAAPKVPEGDRLFLDDVPWDTYETLLHLLEGRHLRLAYDEGRLEITSVSSGHERSKKLLARMVEAYTEEMDVPIRGLGNLTLRRQLKDKGLEPDDCWYIQNVEAIVGCDPIDLNIHPPPDLALEIEVSQSVLDRLRIYAALEVPEIWRYDGRNLTVLVLKRIRYIESKRSPTFPNLPVEVLAEFLERANELDDTRLIKAFRAWVNKNETR